jgi:hypothetical protein
MLKSTFCQLRVVTIALAAVMGGMAGVTTATAPAMAQDEQIEIEAFYNELEPYGRWTDHPRYGQVWSPEVDADWRPYTRGQWVYTEEHGWYWESDEPFAWAVYHYGRWFLDETDGWLWIPGTEWGPAWVAWRTGDDAVGWAPLPPEAGWQDGDIVGGSNIYESSGYSSAWAFVPLAMLTAPTVWNHIAPPRRNAGYLSRTRFVAFHRGGGNGYFNAGLDRKHWESRTGRRITPYRPVVVPRPTREAPRARRGGRELQIYRPRVTGIPRDDGRPGLRPPANGRDPQDHRPGHRRNDDARPGDNRFGQPDRAWRDPRFQQPIDGQRPRADRDLRRHRPDTPPPATKLVPSGGPPPGAIIRQHERQRFDQRRDIPPAAHRTPPPNFDRRRDPPPAIRPPDRQRLELQHRQAPPALPPPVVRRQQFQPPQQPTVGHTPRLQQPPPHRGGGGGAPSLQRGGGGRGGGAAPAEPATSN